MRPFEPDLGNASAGSQREQEGNTNTAMIRESGMAFFVGMQGTGLAAE